MTRQLPILLLLCLLCLLSCGEEKNQKSKSFQYNPSSSVSDKKTALQYRQGKVIVSKTKSLPPPSFSSDKQPPPLLNQETPPLDDTCSQVSAPYDPLDLYRNNKLDPIVRTVPPNIQKRVFMDPDGYLKPLVDYLTSGTNDDFLKVKRIHDWIADNISYDTVSYFSGQFASTSYGDVLKTGSSVCDGYANLFNRMCGLSGITSTKITGYARGVGFNLFEKEDPSDSNHAWNGVLIDGVWYLIDTTWDAGHVSGSAFIKDYSTDYLFLAAPKFIHTHFPSDPKLQQLQPPVSGSQFVELPYLKGVFFSYKLDLESGIKKRNSIGHTERLEINIPPKTEIMATLKSRDGQEVSERTFVQVVCNKAVIDLKTPDSGSWELAIYVRTVGEDKYQHGGSIIFDSQSGTEDYFPKSWAGYDNYKSHLLSPLYAPLQFGKEVEFSLKLSGISAVSVIVGKRWVELKKTGQNKYGGIVLIDADSVSVNVKIGNKNNWPSILSYDVVR